MKKEYLIPLTLIICSLILGGSFYLVQFNKQVSIEKQQQVEIDREKKIAEEQRAEEGINKILYDFCVENAEKAYWDFMELNGTMKADGSITAPTRFWETAKKDKKEAINNCFVRYLK